MTIQFAKIEWQQQLNGTKQPYSLDFNDVYFNSEDGLDETQHVFIDKNDLKSRFKNLKERVFTVFETGFGSGLNFFTVSDCWIKFAPKSAILRYFSIEKLPLTLADMQCACRLWPQFSVITHEFLTYYKNLQFPSNIFSMAECRIVIGLQLGDINDLLPTLQITDKNWLESGVDAFLLDGFAPAKNPDMWSIDNFMHLARIASANATFATFTSASYVRKNLENAGFYVEKHPGFGKKREMLAGYFLSHQKA